MRLASLPIVLPYIHHPILSYLYHQGNSHGKNWGTGKTVMKFTQNIFILSVRLLCSCKWVHTDSESLGSNPLVIRTERTRAPCSWLKGMQARSSFVCACLLPTNLNCSYTNTASTGLCISKLSINRYCITSLPYLSFAQADGRQRASRRKVPSFDCFYF